MAGDVGGRAAGLLVDQAWAAYTGGRYREAVAAASRAVEAAGQLDDPVLLVRALDVEAGALQLMGDHVAALARYTRILGLAEDPASRLDDPQAAQTIADAYWSWTACARFVSGIPVRELYRVLDAAERWLATTGHRDWRASIFLERALTHKLLGELEAAVAAAEEALAVKLQHPEAPGFTLNGIRFQLGDILLDAGRHTEAVPHYQAVLADPVATAWQRGVAHQGLGRYALAAGDTAAARREARTAVLLAEPLGDDALCTSLDVLVAACRAEGDLDAAWQAAARHLEAAERIGGQHRPYHAIRAAVDIALDRADLATARPLLNELDEHAEALDASTATTTYTSETARRRQRLANLEEAAR